MVKRSSRLKTIAVGQTLTGWDTRVISGRLIKPFKIKVLRKKKFKTKKEAITFAKKLKRIHKAPIQFS